MLQPGTFFLIDYSLSKSLINKPPSIKQNAQELEVYSISGQQLGSIHQDWSICTPQFSVKSGASGETVLKISGPFLTISCCKDVVFDVLTRDRETKVGKITKQWSGFTREAFTDADLFGVTFPLDLDVQVKATLLAATFLIVSIL